jgi:hypothetical protein
LGAFLSYLFHLSFNEHYHYPNEVVLLFLFHLLVDVLFTSFHLHNDEDLLSHIYHHNLNNMDLYFHEDDVDDHIGFHNYDRIEEHSSLKVVQQAFFDLLFNLFVHPYLL